MSDVAVLDAERHQIIVRESREDLARHIQWVAMMHAQVDWLQDEMLSKFEAVECETLHHFAPGIYIREMRAPKGTLLTTYTHKTEYLSICLKGSAVIWSLPTGTTKRIDAPAIVPTQPGTRRVGYIYEDCVWLSIHATNETDIAKLEQDLFVETKWLGDAKNHEAVAILNSLNTGLEEGSNACLDG